MGCSVSRLSLVVLMGLVLAGCSGNSERRDASSPLAPSGPAVARPAPTSGGMAAPASAGKTPGTPGEAAPVRLPAEEAAGALDVAFPGRNESFQFRQELEAKYRDGAKRERERKGAWPCKHTHTHTQ